MAFVRPILKFNHEAEAERYTLSQAAEQYLKVRFPLENGDKIILAKLSEALCAILKKKETHLF